MKITVSFALLFATCGRVVSQNATTLPITSEVPSTKESHHPSGAPTQEPTKTPTQTPTETKPNLIMIMTDEHNLRTLGCYRDLMDEKQAFPWGEGVKVDTPNIDQLAKDGAVFKNFYTVTPRK